VKDAVDYLAYIIARPPAATKHNNEFWKERNRVNSLVP